MGMSTPARDGSQRPDGSQYETVLSEDQWRERLSSEEYRVLREAGTEPAYQGEFTNEKRVGSYSCRACGAALFTSETKFDSHCGWPSFYEPLAKDSVVYLEDNTLGQTRTEVRCASCGGHLGHVFTGEGFGTPTDQRYCINSISVNFESP
jgi:peptide-methionine (R)-S-oxide reductase